ncbi:sensor histidine kinase [Achromobacter aloeverae]|uniref:histidine kinase n=1 Tax=Achromobacter aloeverae TaxID=1750518 RepID=A0A4Q1HJ16_9BURK|nr:HWE histidine kinase domain-containing protein [Achromobacter aloeverae]RXN88087.1 histidine kinase [Achromobacter aloeverae]
MSDEHVKDVEHRIRRLQQLARAYADVRPADGRALLDELAQLSASLSAAVDYCTVERSRRDKEARYRSIVESAIDYAILTLGLDGTVQSWNPGASRMFGYEEKEVLGRSLDLILTAQDQAIKRNVFERQMANQLGHATNERWHLCKDGRRVWGSGMMMPLRDAAGNLEGYLKIMRDDTDRRKAAESQRLLLDELNHRVKNSLAAVHSLAHQTYRHAGDLEQFMAQFESRLLALSRAHDLLTRSTWRGTTLSELLQATLEPYDGTPARFRIGGPNVVFAPNAALTLNMAFHELATNAAKYGALSVQAGLVEVQWLRSAAGHAATAGAPGKSDEDADRQQAGVATTTQETSERLAIVWTETGGPPVAPPLRRGFGSRLIERGIAQEIGGKATLEFAPGGLVCRIDVPLENRVEVK